MGRVGVVTVMIADRVTFRPFAFLPFPAGRHRGATRHSRLCAGQQCSETAPTVVGKLGGEDASEPLANGESLMRRAPPATETWAALSHFSVMSGTECKVRRSDRCTRLGRNARPRLPPAPYTPPLAGVGASPFGKGVCREQEGPKAPNQ